VDEFDVELEELPEVEELELLELDVVFDG